MVYPFDRKESIAANVDHKIDLWDYFGRVPVEYVRIKCTEDFRIWMVYMSGTAMEYHEGGFANIPLELTNYGLKAVIVRPTAAATIYTHATTYAPEPPSVTAVKGG